MGYTAAQKRAYARKMAARRAASQRYRAPYRRVSGAGDYKISRPMPKEKKKSWWDAPKTFGAAGGFAGGALGNLIAPGVGGAVGGIAGEAFGKGLGHIFRSVTGWGDYVVRKNSILYPSQSVPQFGPGRTCIRVQHKEYIASISSSTSFVSQSFSINPGLESTFPWLSQIAQQFEQYHINGMMFGFVSTSADALNSTNTALGKIVCATDYNSADPNYTSIQQMMGSEFSTMGKPSDPLLHAIECDPAETPVKLYYVRTGAPPANTDLRLYDLGKFQIATDGSQAAAVVGDLWVTYDVTFCKPQLNNVLGLNLSYYHGVTTGVSASNPFGASGPGIRDGSNLAMTYSSNSMFFPPNLSSGTYFVSYNVSGTSVATSMPTIATTRCTQVPNMWVATTQPIETTSGMTGTVIIGNFYLRLTGQNASFNFSGGTLPGSGVLDLVIVQVPDDLS